MASPTLKRLLMGALALAGVTLSLSAMFLLSQTAHSQHLQMQAFI